MYTLLIDNEGMAMEPENQDSYEIRIPETKFGIVVIIDALGSSTLSSSGAQAFIRNREHFLKQLSQFSYKSDQINPELRPNLKKLQPFTFGDTMIFAWELPPERKNYYKYMPIVLEYIMPLITIGFRTQLMWRGCISCGEFCADAESNTIIGPAVADAAQWYNKASWIGIIASPFCGKVITRSAIDQGGKSKFGLLFCEYEVPLKTASNETYFEKMWVVSWPAMYSDAINPSADFYRDIEQFPIPKGAEQIYYATREFFEWYFKTVHQKAGKLNQP